MPPKPSLWDRCNLAWWLFVVLHAIAFAFDFWLIETGHESISYRTWVQVGLHPTLQGAGILFYLGVAYLVRRWRWMVLFSGIMIGHLFFHT